MFDKSVLASTTAILFASMLAGPALADPQHCPPGHEKKGWCEFGERSDLDWDRDNHDRANADYVFLQDPGDYRLPPLPEGQRYAVVDNRVVVVSSDTYATIAVIGALSDLLR